MSSTTRRRVVAEDRPPNQVIGSPRDAVDSYESGEGAGWLFFAASILGLAGVMRIIDSIWAFGYHGSVPEGLKGGVFGSDLRTYAWIWLGVGTLLIASSFLVLARSQFGRWVGFFAAGVGAVSAIAWMPYYPIWSFVYIALATLVFCGLVAYGGREPS